MLTLCYYELERKVTTRMTKPNYRAWEIDDSEFPEQGSDLEKLLFFGRYAILAPSGHNSQPWLIIPEQDYLRIQINPDHHLSGDGSGLLSVEPYISIGTFLEVFYITAKAFGHILQIKLNADTDDLATIRISSLSEKNPALLEAVKTRVSNRSKYSTQLIDQNLLKYINSNDFEGVSITTLVDKNDIEFIATKTAEALTYIMSEPKYREELSQWVRLNQTKKFDGMPGFTHGFGSAKSMISKFAIKHAPNQGPQAQKSADLIRSSGALLIVRISDERKQSFINAGRLYSSICVKANEKGISTSALGASVISPTTRDNVKKHFNIVDRPVYIIRLGISNNKAPHSPRWPLEKVIKADS